MEPSHLRSDHARMKRTRPLVTLTLTSSFLLLSTAAMAQVHPAFVGCESPDNVVLASTTGQPDGNVQIWTDGTQLSLVMQGAPSRFFDGRVSVHISTNGQVPVDPLLYSNQYSAGNDFIRTPIGQNPPYPPAVENRMELLLPLPQGPFTVSIVAEVVRMSFFGAVTAHDDLEIYAVPYRNPCCAMEAGKFRTQSQGGWGTTASGNNPGAYRDAHFPAAFPAGITVGCTGGNTVYLSTSQAVAEVLPAGGPHLVLDNSATNPARRAIKNKLLGQTVALAVSLGFDALDQGYDSSPFPLGGLVLTTGTYAGLTVADVFALANAHLGGCEVAIAATELNSVVDMINNAFEDGTEIAGPELTCPAN